MSCIRKFYIPEAKFPVFYTLVVLVGVKTSTPSRPLSQMICPQLPPGQLWTVQYSANPVAKRYVNS